MISLEEQIARISQDSGIYIFKDKKGQILYIGKAKRLRARLLQYIHGHDGRDMVERLLKRAKTVEVTITESEKAALILEAHLIGMYKPPYNVRLLDGGQFLFLGMQRKRDWPYPYVVRRSVPHKGEELVGPYPAAGGIRKTLQFVERNFLLRTCSDRELKQAKRPCLQYQMHQCLAPCVQKCTPEEYEKEVERVLLFLRGKSTEVIERTKEKMIFLAEAERFEEAAKHRDLIVTLQKTLEEQQVAQQKDQDSDVWGLYLEGENGMVAILPVRSGMMQEVILVPLANLLETEADALLSTILVEWYGNNPIPKEILIEVELSNQEALMEFFSEKMGLKIHIRVPQRGEKTKKVALACKNAEAAFARLRSKEDEKKQLLESVQKICQLSSVPHRMECFDNSHLSSSNPVASMVTFVNGVPDKSLYRKFRIPEELGGDDYGSMRTVLERRFIRAKEQQKGWEFPDLLVVDGGRGQLNVACEVLKDLGCIVPVIGIAKPRTEHKKGQEEASDKLFLVHVKEPIRLPKHSPVLRLLQHLRDETHNQAVAFQAKRRQKKTLVSVLDKISGLGEKRKKQLIQSFGTIQAIKEASIDELSSVTGISKTLAHNIYEYFHPNKK